MVKADCWNGCCILCVTLFSASICIFKLGYLLVRISLYHIFEQGEDVYLVGDFTDNWKEPIQAVHKGGPRFEAEVRLSQGK